LIDKDEIHFEFSATTLNGQITELLCCLGFKLVEIGQYHRGLKRYSKKEISIYVSEVYDNEYEIPDNPDTTLVDRQYILSIDGIYFSSNKKEVLNYLIEEHKIRRKRMIEEIIDRENHEW